MEYSLHRQLKQLYAGSEADTEVRLAGYRIDAVCGDELIEIQHGSLLAIRDKIAALCQAHSVRVVKPIVAAKHLVKLARRNGKVRERRASPKRGKLLDVFDELVHWTRVFPHANLALEVVLVEVEETRYPGHGRRRRHRASDFQVADQVLLAAGHSAVFRTPADLLGLVPRELPVPFHTGHLAAALNTSRFQAQRVAYCLRHMGAISEVGKEGNARLYRLAPNRGRRQVAS